MLRFLLFCGINFVAFFGYAQDDNNCSYRYSRNLLQFAEENASIEKHLAIQDIKTFCLATTKNQLEKDLQSYGFASARGLRPHVVSNLGSVGSWFLGYSPSPEHREQILSGIGPPDKEYEHLADANKAEQFLLLKKELLEDNPPVDLQSPRLSKKIGSSAEAAVKQKPTLAEKTAFCFELVFSRDCVGALDSVIEQSLPNEYNITQVDLYKEILNEKKYDEGLRLAALKVIERFKNKDKKGFLAKSSLFEDIENSFVAAGNTKDKAKEMTWKTMGLLASGGPNTSYRVLMIEPRKANSLKKTAIGVLSTLPYALDTQGFATGQVYSYPRSLHTTCDSGKPYHFWMSAYLAWDQTQKGKSAKGAAAAAFLANKGYQMFSATETRTPTKPLVEDFLGVYSNSIRMDLAYASAGAVYGANAGANSEDSKIDLDEGLKNIISESSRQPKLNKNEARVLFNSPVMFAYKWSSVMSPNSAFTLFKKQLQ